MGCDYYILINLYIYFNDDIYNYLTIELERHKGYYFYDGHDEDKQEKMDEYIKSILRPRMKPIIIYDNNEFISSKFETKYKDLIDNELQESSDNLEWKHIREIAIMESRFERE